MWGVWLDGGDRRRKQKTRFRYASLAAVLSVQARMEVIWLAATAYARLDAKDRRLLNVFCFLCRSPPSTSTLTALIFVYLLY